MYKDIINKIKKWKGSLPIFKVKKNKKPERLLSYDEKYLIYELTQSKNALDAAYSCFENATEPDIIDSCIYQVNSAQIRYKFLLEKAKAANLTIAIPVNVLI